MLRNPGIRISLWYKGITFCLRALDNDEDSALFNRALQLLSHGAYAIHEPKEMGDDNKDLFRRILRDFVTRFEFALPGAVPAPPPAPAPAPVHQEAPTP